MKKKVELDVDFIGGGHRPTNEEFIGISEYIKAAKDKKKMRKQGKVSHVKPTSKQPL